MMIESDSTQSRPETHLGTSSTRQTFYTAKEIDSDATEHMQVSGIEPAQSDVDDRLSSLAVPQNQRILAQLANNTAKLPAWIANDKTERYGPTLDAFDVEGMATGVLPEHLAYLKPTVLANDPIMLTSFALSHDFRKRRDRQFQPLRDRSVPRWIAAASTQAGFYHLLAGIEGSPDTPYERGVFWLDITCDSDFAFKPPKMRFLTRFYHPNIDCHGKICMDLLEDQWSPGISLEMLLISLCSLLAETSLDDPLVSEIAQTYCENYEFYYQNARRLTTQHAMSKQAEVGLVEVFR